MPMYTYRREDGTTFEIRQKFLDEPLQVCPSTGQRVVRLVQATGVIFKGSGFYVTDNKGSAKSPTSTSKTDGKESTSKESASTPSAPATSTAPAAPATTASPAPAGD